MRAFSCVFVKKDGKLRLLDEPGYRAFVQTLGDGEEVTCAFTDGSLDSVRSHIRSQKANNYLWGHVYVEMAKHTGHSPDDLHDAMCERFLPNEHKRVEFYNHMSGEQLTVETDGRRSSKQSPTDFYDFVEQIRAFALEFLGVETQDPDPEYWRRSKRRRKDVAA